MAVFGVAESPNFVEFEALARKTLSNLIVEFQTPKPDIAQEFQDGVLANIRQPSGGTNRISFNKAGQYLCPFGEAESVHRFSPAA
jgi:hypothetical protein